LRISAARSKACISATTSALPSLTDLLFISKYYKAKDNIVGSEVIHRVLAAFQDILRASTWLDNATKRIALAKVQRLILNIGAPKEYSLLRFPVGDSYFNNSGWASTAAVVKMFSLLDLSVERSAWTFAADTVNAWYDDTLNEVFVPAGILMIPFFSAEYTAARNFGAIGTVVGHEISHGFDIKGANFNEVGEVEMWWTEQTASTFDRKVECIADLYDGFQVNGIFVDGFHTLGENIADMGGVKMALRAYREWSAQTQGKELDTNKLRLFFLTYGQLWCEKERPDNSRFMILRDMHAPKKFRVNGVLSQNDDFAKAFSCPASAPMNPPSKCTLW
jgi:predicted metalloendopeptidase